MTFLSSAVLHFFYHYFFDTPPKTNNMFVTYFHEFRIYIFFTKNVLFSFRGALKGFFDLNRKIIPFLKSKTRNILREKNCGFGIRENMSRTC